MELVTHETNEEKLLLCLIDKLDRLHDYLTVKPKQEQAVGNALANFKPPTPLTELEEAERIKCDLTFARKYRYVKQCDTSILHEGNRTLLETNGFTVEPLDTDRFYNSRVSW